jgi:hypothetical protein
MSIAPVCKTPALIAVNAAPRVGYGVETPPAVPVVESTLTGPPVTSAGHEALEPVQASAGSQAPVEGRQLVPDATNTSAGQVLDVPVHVSARSHRPAAPRQVNEPD